MCHRLVFPLWVIYMQKRSVLTGTVEGGIPPQEEVEKSRWQHLEHSLGGSNCTYEENLSLLKILLPELSLSSYELDGSSAVQVRLDALSTNAFDCDGLIELDIATNNGWLRGLTNSQLGMYLRAYIRYGEHAAAAVASLIASEQSRS